MTRTPDSPQTSEPLRIPRQDVSMLKARAQGLAVPRHRRLLGLTGSPGAGKSTLAEQVVDMLPGLAVLLPMDGFHLAQEQLVVLDKVATKGAIDTFDGAGFVHLLERIRGNEERTIYAPVFRRDLEEPIAGSIAIDPDVPLVVVEGNYLLATSGGGEGCGSCSTRSGSSTPVRRHVCRGSSHGTCSSAVTAPLPRSAPRGATRSTPTWCPALGCEPTSSSPVTEHEDLASSVGTRTVHWHAGWRCEGSA